MARCAPNRKFMVALMCAKNYNVLCCNGLIVQKIGNYLKNDPYKRKMDRVIMKILIITGISPLRPDGVITLQNEYDEPTLVHTSKCDYEIETDYSRPYIYSEENYTKIVQPFENFINALENIAEFKLNQMTVNTKEGKYSLNPVFLFSINVNEPDNFLMECVKIVKKMLYKIINWFFADVIKNNTDFTDISDFKVSRMFRANNWIIRKLKWERRLLLDHLWEMERSRETDTLPRSSEEINHISSHFVECPRTILLKYIISDL